MKLYKLSTRDKCWEHQGYFYCASQQEAVKTKREIEAKGCECEFEVIEMGQTKREIIKALNRHAAHPDNG